jgi:hypothetical protein
MEDEGSGTTSNAVVARTPPSVLASASVVAPDFAVSGTADRSETLPSRLTVVSLTWDPPSSTANGQPAKFRPSLAVTRTGVPGDAARGATRRPRSCLAAGRQFGDVAGPPGAARGGDPVLLDEEGAGAGRPLPPDGAGGTGPALLDEEGAGDGDCYRWTGTEAGARTPVLRVRSRAAPAR